MHSNRQDAFLPFNVGMNQGGQDNLQYQWPYQWLNQLQASEDYWNQNIGESRNQYFDTDSNIGEFEVAKQVINNKEYIIEKVYQVYPIAQQVVSKMRSALAGSLNEFYQQYTTYFEKDLQRFDQNNVNDRIIMLIVSQFICLQDQQQQYSSDSSQQRGLNCENGITSSILQFMKNSQIHEKKYSQFISLRAQQLIEMYKNNFDLISYEKLSERMIDYHAIQEKFIEYLRSIMYNKMNEFSREITAKKEQILTNIQEELLYLDQIDLNNIAYSNKCVVKALALNKINHHIDQIAFLLEDFEELITKFCTELLAPIRLQQQGFKNVITDTENTLSNIIIQELMKDFTQKTKIQLGINDDIPQYSAADSGNYFFYLLPYYLSQLINLLYHLMSLIQFLQTIAGKIYLNPKISKLIPRENQGSINKLLQLDSSWEKTLEIYLQYNTSAAALQSKEEDKQEEQFLMSLLKIKSSTFNSIVSDVLFKNQNFPPLKLSLGFLPNNEYARQNTIINNLFQLDVIVQYQPSEIIIQWNNQQFLMSSFFNNILLEYIIQSIHPGLQVQDSNQNNIDNTKLVLFLYLSPYLNHNGLTYLRQFTINRFNIEFVNGIEQFKNDYKYRIDTLKELIYQLNFSQLNPILAEEQYVEHTNSTILSHHDGNRNVIMIKKDDSDRIVRWKVLLEKRFQALYKFDEEKLVMMDKSYINGMKDQMRIKSVEVQINFQESLREPLILFNDHTLNIYLFFTSFIDSLFFASQCSNLSYIFFLSLYLVKNCNNNENQFLQQDKLNQFVLNLMSFNQNEIIQFSKSSNLEEKQEEEEIVMIQLQPESYQVEQQMGQLNIDKPNQLYAQFKTVQYQQNQIGNYHQHQIPSNSNSSQDNLGYYFSSQQTQHANQQQSPQTQYVDSLNPHQMYPHQQQQYDQQQVSQLNQYSNNSNQQQNHSCQYSSSQNQLQYNTLNNQQYQQPNTMIPTSQNEVVQSQQQNQIAQAQSSNLNHYIQEQINQVSLQQNQFANQQINYQQQNNSQIQHFQSQQTYFDQRQNQQEQNIQNNTNFQLYNNQQPQSQQNQQYSNDLKQQQQSQKQVEQVVQQQNNNFKPQLVQAGGNLQGVGIINIGQNFQTSPNQLPYNQNQQIQQNDKINQNLNPHNQQMCNQQLNKQQTQKDGYIIQSQQQPQFTMNTNFNKEQPQFHQGTIHSNPSNKKSQQEVQGIGVNPNGEKLQCQNQQNPKQKQDMNQSMEMKASSGKKLFENSQQTSNQNKQSNETQNETKNQSFDHQNEKNQQKQSQSVKMNENTEPKQSEYEVVVVSQQSSGEIVNKEEDDYNIIKKTSISQSKSQQQEKLKQLIHEQWIKRNKKFFEDFFSTEKYKPKICFISKLEEILHKIETRDTVLWIFTETDSNLNYLEQKIQQNYSVFDFHFTNKLSNDEQQQIQNFQNEIKQKRKGDFYFNHKIIQSPIECILLQYSLNLSLAIQQIFKNVFEQYPQNQEILNIWISYHYVAYSFKQQQITKTNKISDYESFDKYLIQRKIDINKSVISLFKHKPFAENSENYIFQNSINNKNILIYNWLIIAFTQNYKNNLELNKAVNNKINIDSIQLPNDVKSLEFILKKSIFNLIISYYPFSKCKDLHQLKDFIEKSFENPLLILQDKE